MPAFILYNSFPHNSFRNSNQQREQFYVIKNRSSLTSSIVFESSSILIIDNLSFKCENFNEILDGSEEKKNFSCECLIANTTAADNVEC